jgi:hypothetical protein
VKQSISILFRSFWRDVERSVTVVGGIGTRVEVGAPEIDKELRENDSALKKVCEYIGDGGCQVSADSAAKEMCN